MRYLLLFLALLGSAPVLAQTALPPDSVAAAPPAAAAGVAAAPAAAPDTVAAIHRLFAQKRRERRDGLVSIVGISGIATACLASSFSTDAPGGMVSVGAVLAAPAVLAGLLTYRRYSRRREQQALAGFSTHRLPRYVQRNLEHHHFQPPPVRRQPRPFELFRH